MNHTFPVDAMVAMGASWACARAVIGAHSLEVYAYYDALNADLSALGVERGGRVEAEYRAMHWWRGSFSGDERSDQALVREVEEPTPSLVPKRSPWKHVPIANCRVNMIQQLHRGVSSKMFGVWG